MFLRFGKRHKAAPETAPAEPTLSEVLMSARPSDILLKWARDGRLRDIIPDLYSLRGISQLPAHRDDAFVHTMKVVDAIAPIPVRRWSALLHDIGKGPTFIETPEGRSRFFEHDRVGMEMVPEIMAAAGEQDDLIGDVKRLVGLHMRPIAYTPDWTDGAVRRLVEEAQEGRGPDGWYDLLALSHADLRGYLPEPIDRGVWVLHTLEARWRAIQDAETNAAHLAARQPAAPLDGHEILAQSGRDAGPWVAEAKAYLVAEVSAGRLAAGDKVGASALLQQWFADRD